MLDKTALVWFQTNRSKFKDLTMLKMMFLQRYNPWGKAKREQLQSWNILSFNPKTTDIDEHIDLINTLGDMVDQKEEAKKEKFIETMPTMIQTHLIMCKDGAAVKDKRIQMQKDMKDKEANRFAIERAQIEALIEKHRLRTPKTPDKVSRSGTGKNAKVDGQEGTKKEKPPYKKATKDIQIKKSCKKGEKAENAKRGNPDTLLGDLVANTATGTEKAKEKGQKDKIGIDDIGIFEFIFYGLPEPPELEGIDEDRLRELQNAVQEQLHQRDEERERNITKRVQDFEKTFDFVNSYLLKGVATMAELTKTDHRQPMGKIKPTDKMVMMPSLFDGIKPATSKQHYERFNLYINFQT